MYIVDIAINLWNLKDYSSNLFLLARFYGFWHFPVCPYSVNWQYLLSVGLWKHILVWLERCAHPKFFFVQRSSYFRISYWTKNKNGTNIPHMSIAFRGSWGKEESSMEEENTSKLYLLWSLEVYSLQISVILVITVFFVCWYLFGCYSPSSLF